MFSLSVGAGGGNTLPVSVPVLPGACLAGHIPGVDARRANDPIFLQPDVEVVAKAIAEMG